MARLRTFSASLLACAALTAPLAFAQDGTGNDFVFADSELDALLAVDRQTLAANPSLTTVVQASASAVLAGQAFRNSLRAGATQLIHDHFASGSKPNSTRVAGPPFFKTARLDTRNTTAWLSGHLSSVDIDASGNSLELYGTSWGVSAGVEYRLPLDMFDSAAVGIAGGFTSSDIDPALPGDADVETWSAGVYLGTLWEDFRTDLSLSYSGFDIDSFTALSGTSAATDGEMISGLAEVSYNMTGTPKRGFTVAPLVRGGFSFADFDGITGTGEERLGNGELNQGLVGAGARFGINDSSIRRGDRRFTLDLVYERVLGDDAVEFGFGPVLPDGDVTDIVVQKVVDENRLNIGSTAAFEIMNTFDLSISYDGHIGEDVHEHRASVRTAFRF